MSEENLAIARAIFEGGAGTSKEAILAALPEAIPALIHPDAEWVEAPERVDSTTYRGHDGIRESFERWLEQWGEYRVEPQRFEDHGEKVLVVVHEYGEGHGSGASTEATIYVVLTFRDGKISRYREFYDEEAARSSLG
ncbi:MAG TPA: nuclear transport factor 2 family protein [Solirubrobacterales bacterium]|nr:nuclear transport factor 2 family protein [Solirubrobacterales bacterium]